MGSMISLINKKVLEGKFPNLKMHFVGEFMGTGLKLSAANHTGLQIQGITLYQAQTRARARAHARTHTRTHTHTHTHTHVHACTHTRARNVSFKIIKDFTV